MFAGEDVTRSTPIGSQFVNIIDSAQHLADDTSIPEIADNKFVRRGCIKFAILYLETSDPLSFPLSVLHQMTANGTVGNTRRSSGCMSDFGVLRVDIFLKCWSH